MAQIWGGGAGAPSFLTANTHALETITQLGAFTCEVTFT